MLMGCAFFGNGGRDLDPAEIIINGIIRASRFDGEDNGVYFVGPFSRRVSFGAQQNRALNLVYALRARDLLHGPIAVVGAGLAGLLITSTLVALDYEVDLFESKPRIFAHQRNTRHRFVHPTVNAWPEHPSLDLTTQLPFFDWCAGICNEVISGFEKEWTPIRDKLLDKKRLHLETEVLNYRARKAGISLEIKSAKDAKLFKTVIFATGFEVEKTIANADEASYWDDDRLERVRDNDGNARFAISGIGDGGLIDSLRLVHNEFEGGKLAVRVATALFESDIARRIKKAEAAFEADHKPSIERELEAVYDDSVRALPNGLRKELDISCSKILPLVWLIGNSETPFGRNAAPIHKLLVAHAIQQAAVSYVNGTLKIDENRRISIEPESEAPRLPLHSALIRHGAESTLMKLLKAKPAQLEKLISAQKNLSDDLISPFWMNSEIPKAFGYPEHNPKAIEFVKSRFDRARWVSSGFGPTCG